MIKNKCITPYCKNNAAPNRKICYKCKSRQLKKNRPVTYTFNLLRCNAKHRGKEFDLTLDQFREFCRNTGYIEGKGKNSESLSIDRIDHNKGYSIDNIRILTIGENSALNIKMRSKYKHIICNDRYYRAPWKTKKFYKPKNDKNEKNSGK